MFKNYIKVAIRNIMKHRFFSGINVLGMTIGLTACLLIVLYVVDELSYDRFHENALRIYQVGLHGRIGEQDIKTTNTCPPLARALMEESSDVEDATRIAPLFGQSVVKYGELAFTEEKLFFADSNFFQFFSFELVKGNPHTALQEPNSVVLTEEMAGKYFGKEEAMGKLLSIGEGDQVYKVTGIAANCPSNSHFLFNMLLSSSSVDYLKSTVWLNNFLYTYFLLNEGSQTSGVEKAFGEFVVKYVGPEVEQFMGITLKQMGEQGGAYGYFATPLTDIHLKSTTSDGLEPAGDITYVYFFAVVAIFILVIACINFMNLSTARSAGRAKEVGLRKTLGSLRRQMVWQFLAESFIYSAVSIVLALMTCFLLLPVFNLVSGKTLTLDLLVSPLFTGGLAVLACIVCLLAGSYPAFYLTSFSPVEVLKGKIQAGMKSKDVRRFLVVFQFVISIFLIIFTLVVTRQLRYLQERDLGFDKKNIMILNNARRLGSNMDPFKNELDQHAGIVKSSYTNNNFPGVNNTTVFKAAGTMQDHIMGVYYADYDHEGVMRFQMETGRFFSREFPSDSSAIVLNETAVKEFGWSNPIGEDLLYPFDDGKGTERLHVIGVFKDFNFETLKERVRPLAIRLGGKSNLLMVRYEGSASDMVAKVDALWKKYAAHEPFEYNFLDENFDRLFRSEQRMSRVFGIFSGLAIFVACLGLFALAAFTAEQRTKEVGIRKVMGASVMNLTLMLSREFILLVIMAFVPAALLGWWVVEKWLSGFAYRVELEPLVFVLSGIASIVIAWLTVAFQAIRAAAANPVHSLRYE